MENEMDINDISRNKTLLKKKKTGLIIHGIAMLILGYWPVIAYFIASVMVRPENWSYYLKECIEMPLYEHVICLSGNVFLIPRLYFLYRSYKERLSGNQKRSIGYSVLWGFALAAGIVIFVVSFLNIYSARARKPVIYLYPEEQTQVNVKLVLDGRVTESIPKYSTENGWTVTAEPDGRITWKDGKQYPYLYWEGPIAIRPDMSKGFCVEGKDTEAFLKDAVRRLGLNETEAKDFLEYWVPIMEKNKYNIITFQTAEYEKVSGLVITPEPDTVIRVNMLYYAYDSFVEMEPQDLDKINPSERKGFTVVEWGGEIHRKSLFPVYFD